MNEQQYKSSTDRAVDEAAEWFVRLRSPEFDPNDRPTFAEWLLKSTDHVREYLKLTLLGEDIGRLETNPALNIQVLIDEARLDDGSDNIVGLFDSRATPGAGKTKSAGKVSPRRRAIAFSLVAAVVTAIAVGVTWFYYPASVETVRTATGAQTTLPLADGSMVVLNTQTEIRIAYSRQTRNIYLVYGEALFEVEKDSTRPFRVFAGNALTQAVGTTFNVRRNTGDATVTVVEGVVDVSLANKKSNASIANGRQADSAKVAPVRLEAGHQAVVQENSGRINVMSADPGKVLAWRQRRLVFDAETLASAVEEFNRYNRAKMVISDGELNDVLVSGVFSANDRESFAQFLQAARLAEFKIGYDSVIVLSERAPD